MNSQEFLEKIKIELKISKNSDYTIRNYIDANSKLLSFSNKRPEEITEDDVKSYIVKNLSNRASTSIVVFLSAIKFAYLTILKKDLTSGIKRPKRERKNPVVLSKKEVKLLIEVLNTKKSKLMISFMYACGMRVSELINLKINDLDFNEKIGHIKQAKGRKDRIFNIPEFLFLDLKKQVEKQKEINGEWKDGKENGQGTYTWADGNKYVGGWKNGLFHGYGTATNFDGRTTQGIFKDGELIEEQ